MARAYKTRMRRVLVAGLLVLGPTAIAQEPVIKRSAPMTLTGEIVDISCYKSKGVAGGTGAAHVDCAKICILAEGRRGRHPHRRRRPLQDLGRHAAQDKYAKVLPFIGQTGRDHRHRSHALEQLRRSFVRSADRQTQRKVGLDEREITRLRHRRAFSC